MKPHLCVMTLGKKDMNLNRGRRSLREAMHATRDSADVPTRERNRCRCLFRRAQPAPTQYADPAGQAQGERRWLWYGRFGGRRADVAESAPAS
jgi:hypothetical protein